MATIMIFLKGLLILPRFIFQNAVDLRGDEMIDIGGIAISIQMVYAILIFGTFSLIQPWSMTLKTIGVMIGIGAYALLPFSIAGVL